tara:strand:- start:517 stop:657 length:141 start_codon:yes stop_codon:yes gene_type:complete
MAEEKKNKTFFQKWKWMILTLVLLLIGGGAFYMYRKKISSGAGASG